MGLFKRIGRKVRKIGQKAIEQASIGARKVAKTAKKIQPYLAKAGEIASTIGAVTGQPELVGIGESLETASIAAGGVAKVAEKGRGGIEKLRSIDTAKQGVEEILEAGQEGYGMFGQR